MSSSTRMVVRHPCCSLRELCLPEEGSVPSGAKYAFSWPGCSRSGKAAAKRLPALVTWANSSL